MVVVAVRRRPGSDFRDAHLDPEVVHGYAPYSRLVPTIAPHRRLVHLHRNMVHRFPLRKCSDKYFLCRFDAHAGGSVAVVLLDDDVVVM